VKKALNLSHGWNDISVNECFQNWATQNYILQALPAYICWNIWLDKNKSIFEERPPSLQRIVYLSQGALGKLGKILKVRIPRFTSSTLPMDKTLAWFDGATQ